jgi:hypothetical protein
VLYLALRFVHIAAMAAWFAPVLFVAGDARRSIEAGDLAGLRGRLARSGPIAAGAGLVTVVTGIALIFAMGGFGAVPVTIHVGLTLGLVMWLLGALGIGGTARRIDAAIAAGAGKEQLLPLARRLGMLAGIFHLLWAVTLGLMVFRHVAV